MPYKDPESGDVGQFVLICEQCHIYTFDNSASLLVSLSRVHLEANPGHLVLSVYDDKGKRIGGVKCLQHATMNLVASPGSSIQ